MIYDSLKELGREKEMQQVAAKRSLVFQLAIVAASFPAGYLYQIWAGLPYFIYATSQLVTVVLFCLMQEPKIDSEIFGLREILRW